MKSGSWSFERWAIAAGIAFSVAAWWRSVEPLPEPDDAPLDDAALQAGAFEVELTRARRAPRSRRFASSLVFVSLFFAGAAITAGAGNQFAHTDEPAVAEATADSPAPVPAAETATPAAPAPEPAVAPEPAPQAAPEPASPDEVTAASAPTRADYVAPDPSRVQAAPAAPAPAVRQAHTARKQSQARTRRTESRPAPLFPALAAFVPAIPFDLQSWEHDNPASSAGATAVAIAQHFVGTPYVWGGASPSGGFDCSGLMMYVYGQLGISLPHYAAAQFAIFPRLSPSELQPGDLVFFEPKVDGPGHVAMYAGGDAIIEAPHTGALVRIGSLARSAALLGFMGAVRPYDAAERGARMTASAHAHASGIGTAESALSV